MLRRRNCQVGLDKGRVTFDVHQIWVSLKAGELTGHRKRSAEEAKST